MEVDGGEFTQEGEVAAAVWAGVGREFRELGFRVGVGAEVEADRLPGFDGGTAHEAVMAHSGEAFRQDVEEPAADELENREGEDAGFPSLAAGPMELDVALLVGADEAFGTDGAAFDVTG